MRVKIELGYDGTRFHGWATQPGMATVQGTVEDCLATILRVRSHDRAAGCGLADGRGHADGHGPDPEPEPMGRLVVAGRTDAGVHASHQICHVDVDPELLDGVVGHMGVGWSQALAHRMNHLLPPDIRIINVSQAPKGFDARFSALDRLYVYRLADGSGVVDPRLRGFVASCGHTLDVDVMNDVASLMIGLHDFGSFAIPSPHGTTIRNVIEAAWHRCDTGDGCLRGVAGDLMEFTIRADAFAHNMVRSLVGASIIVGSGKRDVAWFSSKLDVPRREGFTGPAEARGLTLERVRYPDDAFLGSRAESVKALRTLDGE